MSSAALKISVPAASSPAKSVRFVRDLHDGSVGHLGTAVAYRDGWRFLSNVTSHKSSRKFHPTMKACLPRWIGYPDRCRSEHEVRFTHAAEDRDLIAKIVERADRLGLIFKNYSRLTCQMDVNAVHSNGNPLRLADLLAADDFNFMHDIAKIARFLDRETGKLTDNFIPRFSLRTKRAA